MKTSTIEVNYDKQQQQHMMYVVAFPAALFVPLLKKNLC